MLRLVTAGQMRAIDRRAMDEWGIPGLVLMENAGRSCVDALEEALEDLDGLVVAVVCGKGNNGGDGFVIARNLLNRGAEVRCALLGRKADLKGDAATNAGALASTEVPIEEIADPDELLPMLLDADVVVDAVFGTGLDRAPEGLQADAIRLVNDCEAFVLSVDVPSGVSADTGEAFDPSVDADLTVSMALPKYGHLLHPGRARCGEVEVADIGIPERAMLDGGDTWLLDDKRVYDALPERPEHGHKGTFGTCIVMAGARGYTGAACLAARSAVRAGAGLVKLAVPAGCCPVVESHVLEPVKVPLPETEAGTLSQEALGSLLEIGADAGAFAIGPGITTDPDTAALVCSLLPELDRPFVLDADGINCLSGSLDVLKKLRAPAILTPHPGELARLTGGETARVNADRIETARSFTREHGIFLVLKGAPTVVASPEGIVYVNPTGNSGLGSGGTGDVLTGLIAGLLAQGAPPLDAACAGVFLHGRAADLAIEDLTEYSLCASDVLEAIPPAFASILDPGTA